jgi:signal transduction histidine kinase
LRVRLVAGFTAAMAVLLTAAGAFVYWRVEFALDRGLDAELETAAATLTSLVRGDGSVTDRRAADATGVAWQVLTPSGQVVTRGVEAPTHALVPTADLPSGPDRTAIVDTGRFLPAAEEPYRTRVTRLDDGSFLIVAVRRDHRDEALRELLLQLLLAGAGSLLIAGIVGERLAHAALSPVERYRRRASDIAGGRPGLRLDVPDSRDDEVTRLGDTLNRMLDSLEDALARERRFVNDASHELRTPITLLSSRIQLARRRRRTVEEHEAVLAELEVDVARLAALVEHLLALSSGERAAARAGGRAEGGGSPESGTTELAAVARHAVERRLVAGVDQLGDVAVEEGAPGDAAYPALVPLSLLDAERDLSNLLANAQLHWRTPVRVHVRADEHWVALAVSDAGEGIPAELVPHATGRFARAPEARNRPGSGLGLALVDDIVRAVGGELRLCHGGRHHPERPAVNGPCRHDERMTVTVVLPRAGAPAADDRG